MDFTALTTLDYLVFGVVTVSTLFAFSRGFIGSLLSLIGWIAAIYLSYELYPEFKPFLASKISNELILLTAGHAILLVGLLVAFAFFNAFVGSILKKFTGTGLDRLLGIGFGAVRGVLILAFFFMIFSTTMIILKKGDDKAGKKSEDEIMPKFLTEAQTYPLLKTSRDVLEDFIPQSFNERAKQAINSITDKSTKDRAYSDAIKTLQKNISNSDLEDVMNATKDDYKEMSRDEAEKHKLDELIKKYKNGKNNENADDSTIDDDDMNRIESLLE